MHFSMHLDNAETLLTNEGLMVDSNKVIIALKKIYQDLFQQRLSLVEKTATWKQLVAELESTEKTEFDKIGPNIALINQEIASQATEKLKEVYLAGDVDDDGSIGWDEFIMLVRHIDPSQFSLLQTTEMYLQNCDQIVESTNERTMTFEKFSILAKEHNLFNKKNRIKFAESKDESGVKNLESLKNMWSSRKKLLIQRFESVEQNTPFFQNLIKKIDEYFQSFNTSKLNEITIWFIYRFLEEESKRVMMEKQINRLLIQEFVQFSDATLQIISEKYSQ